MADGAQPKDTTTTQQQPAGAGSQQQEPPKQEPPKPPPAPASPPVPPAQTQQQPPPGEPAKPTTNVPTRKLIGEDDEIPDDADLLEMPKKALKSRLARHTKGELKARFGTDDFDEIKAKLDKLTEFEKKQEEQRLAQLSETERLKEQLAAAERARADAEQRVQKEQLTRVLEHEDRRATRILAKYIDEDDVEDVIPRLARHINGLSDEDLVNPEKVIEDWAKGFIQKKPKFAKVKPKDDEEKEKPKPPPEKVLFSNGPPSGGKPTGSLVPNLGEKTAAPGKPNSMTQKEWAEYKRANGLNF